MAKRVQLNLAAAVLAVTFAHGAVAGGAMGAVGGLGDAMQSIGDNLLRADLEAENQRKQVELQHRLEMERIAREQAQLQRSAVDDDQRARNRAESARVEAAHPNWLKTIQSARFKAWLAAQPASLRAMAQNPASTDQVILVLDLFKRDAAH
jgi:hypothetical protein